MEAVGVLLSGIGLGLAVLVAVATTVFSARILLCSEADNMRYFRIDPNSIEKRPRMPK